MVNNSSNATVHPMESGDIQKAIMYVLAAIFVIFINSMTIASYYLRKKSRRAIPDVFMLSLSVSAIITMVAVILILAYVRATGNVLFVGLKPLCYIQVYFGTWLRVTDVSITTAITIDRFLALYKPFMYRVKVRLKYGKIVCCLMWLVSGVVAFLPLVGFGDISMHMQSFCTADWSSEIAYVVLSMAYVQFVIVLVCYVGIFRAISGLVSRQKSMSKSQTLSYVAVTKRTGDEKVTKDNLEAEVKADLSISQNASKDEITKQTLNPIFEKDGNTSTVKPTYINPIFEKDGNISNIKPTYINPMFEMDDPSEVPEQSTCKTTIKIDTKVKIKTVVTKKISSEIVSIFRHRKKSSKSSKVSIQTKNRVTWRENVSEKQLKGGEFAAPQVKKNLDSQQGPPLKNMVKPDCGNSFTTKKPTIKQTISQRFTKNEKSFKRSPSTSSIRTFWTESRRFAKVMGVVVFIFYISWIPLALSINMVLVQGLQRFSNNYYNMLWLSYNLSLISPVGIPISYAIMCKPYRASYKKLWSFVKKKFKYCCGYGWRKDVHFTTDR